jgi:L-glutamine-phosphate cytidylyltransferase
MKAIVVSAGQGTRLLPLTQHLPKCLVEVNRRAILDHQIAALHIAGIEQVIVVGGYRAGQIREHLAAHPTPVDTRLIINPFWSVASSIGSVWAAREYLDSPFCLINGDTIFDASVFERALQNLRPGVNLLVEATDTPAEDDMRVQAANLKVLAVGKNLPLQDTTHRSLGVVMCPDHNGPYGKALQTVIEAPEGHNAYHHAVIDHLARSNAGVTAIPNQGGLWCEVDRPEDIEQWTQDHTAQPMARALP